MHGHVRIALSGIALLTLAACAGRGVQAAGGTSATTTSVPPLSAVSAAPPTTSGPAPPPTSSTTKPDKAGEATLDLHDGRHTVFITGVDVAKRQVTFDLVQKIVGDAATAAYHRDTPWSTSGETVDYWILNESPRLRSASVDRDAVVRLIDYQADTGIIEAGPASFETMAERVAQTPDEFLPSEYEISIRHGVITALEEQGCPWVDANLGEDDGHPLCLYQLRER